MEISLAWDVRRRFRGLGTLVIGLTIVFGLEWLLAVFLGFTNVEGMLDSLALQDKRMLVAVAGPWVHQGWGHLWENLVFLLVFGSYVEWQIGSWDFGKSVAGIGYLSCWLLLSLGGAGAVGASSVTYGLKMLAGFLGVVHFGEKLPEVDSIWESLSAGVHLLPLVFGFGLTYFEIIEWLGSPQSATHWIHVLGAFVGASIGGALALQRVGEWWQSRRKTSNFSVSHFNRLWNVNAIQILLALIAILALAIVAVILSFISGTINRELAVFLMQTAGTLATLLFIGATFYTVRQNQETINELRKDREKEIVIDEIGHVIQPAINNIDKNIEDLEQGSIRWSPGELTIPTNGSEWGPEGKTSIKKPVVDGLTDEPALRRSKRRNPELHSNLTKYETEIDELNDAVHQLVAATGVAVAKEVETTIGRYEWSRGRMAVSPERFLSYLIDESGWESRDLPGGWSELMEDYANEFWGIMESNTDGEFQKVRDIKASLLRESKAVREDLIRVRNELQQEYGISLQDFTDG